MKHILFAVIAFFLSVSFIFAQKSENNFCEKIESLKDLIEKRHYIVKPIDNLLSKSVFKLFIEKIDTDKLYLFKTDVDILKTDELLIDDYITRGECVFIERYAEILKQRGLDILNNYEALKTANIDYSGQITLSPLSKEKYRYYNNESELILSLTKRVGYNTLRLLSENHQDINQTDPRFKILEQELRIAVIDREICRVNTFLKSNSNGLLETIQNHFLNALSLIHI